MKKISLIYLILAFTLMLLPAVAMPLFADAQNTEKRELSELPPLVVDGGYNQQFASEMNTYIQEHIGFRNIMVSANSMLRTGVFGQAAKEEIIVGKDGWLFYGESLADYLNIATVTPRNAANIAHTVRLFQNYAEENGSVFLLAMVANKNSLYGEYMPYYDIPLKADGNRELFLAALKKEGVSYVDLLPVFAAQEKILYQQTDSHWTYEGALLGYRTIMEKSGLPYERFEGLTFTEREDWPADLAIFLYGEAAKPGVQAYPDYIFTYDITSRQTAVDALTLETRQALGTGNLVIYRDSFCNTMQAYLAQSFYQTTLSRTLPYQADLITSRQADLTVLQMTERTLGSFVYRAPRMAAPETELDVTADQMPEGLAVCHAETAGSYRHLYGTIKESLLGESYRVYLLVDGGGERRAYEAFPIYEIELLGEAEVTDNGWSVYLPAGLIPADASFSLLVESEGICRLFPITEE